MRREAYLRVWPEGAAGEAADDVQDLARAMYQMIHDGGLDALNEMDGLRPHAAAVLMVAADELMMESELEQPEELIAVNGPVLYTLVETW